MQKTIIYGHQVEFEENAHECVRYLRDKLNHSEAQVFFDQAKTHGSAEFEDEHNHSYDLLHHDDGYTLVRR